MKGVALALKQVILNFSSAVFFDEWKDLSKESNEIFDLIYIMKNLNK